MFARKMERMFAQAARRYAERYGEPDPLLAPAPAPEPIYAPIERLPPVTRQWPEPEPERQRPEPEQRWPEPERRWPEPIPQPAAQQLRPQPAPQPIGPRLGDTRQWPEEQVAYHQPAYQHQPEDQYQPPYQYHPADHPAYDPSYPQVVYAPGRMIPIWPPVPPEAGPRGPPPEEWSYWGSVWMFFTRWLWILIAAYARIFARLLLVTPALWLADVAPGVAAALWRALRSPRETLRRLLSYRRFASAARFLGSAARSTAVAVLRAAVRDARVGVSVLLGVWALVVPVASWALWLYFTFHRDHRHHHPELREKLIGWNEEYAVNRYFEDASLWTKPRWRHTAGGEMVRLADWSMI
ncbi:hypothetical protein F4820DRAFT_238250 [Hypoxylon rubiginosum]|uniref:Uncharacterized protein n=1 Tax=Hypoxylon rubiginosum TaxID=110542 RepID=A0ACB9Z743_9PEZI|nr:hypothetical protein F4820DRAFT_238250 [Hypoxylon rubiginosum]